MPLTQLLNRPVTITRRSASGEKDAYGADIESEDTVEVRGELQQRRRGEPGDEGGRAESDWLLVLPAGTAIDSGDAVEVDGTRYEVIGDPWHARNPRTQLESHVEATARRHDYGSEADEPEDEEP